MAYEALSISAGRSSRLVAHQAAKSTGAPAPAALPASAGIYSQSDADRMTAGADARGVARERQRWAAVFASPASRGRERMAATLLASAKNFSAAAIIAELPHLGTDASPSADQPGAPMKRAQAEAAAASWDKAYDSLGGTQPSSPAATRQGASDPSDGWDRVYAMLTPAN